MKVFSTLKTMWTSTSAPKSPEALQVLRTSRALQCSPSLFLSVVFFCVSFPELSESAVLAGKHHWQTDLLFVSTTCLLERFACIELLVLPTCMCLACLAKQLPSFSPHLVALVAFPARVRQPFTIPARRLCQAFNLFTCSNPQNAATASFADYVICLQDNLVV